MRFTRRRHGHRHVEVVAMGIQACSLPYSLLYSATTSGRSVTPAKQKLRSVMACHCFFFQKTLFYSTVHVMAVLHITLFSYCRNCNEQSNFFSQLGMIYLLITGNETLVYGGSTSGVLVKLWVYDFNHQC